MRVQVINSCMQVKCIAGWSADKCGARAESQSRWLFCLVPRLDWTGSLGTRPLIRLCYDWNAPMNVRAGGRWSNPQRKKVWAVWGHYRQCCNASPHTHTQRQGKESRAQVLNWEIVSWIVCTCVLENWFDYHRPKEQQIRSFTSAPSLPSVSLSTA